MNKILYLVVFLVLIVISFLTNPSEQEHKEVVFREVTSCVQHIIDKKSSKDSLKLGTLGSVLGNILLEPIILNLTQNMVVTDNYYLLSLTKIKYNNENNIIGIGLLGHVFLSPNMDEKINQVASDYLNI
jgi:hypothetical protein